MRSIDNRAFDMIDDEHLADLARIYSNKALDTYSDYGVGAILVAHVSGEWYVYAGFNINLSGMECKIHAEQLAAFQLLLDISNDMEVHETMVEEVTLEKVIVVTSDNDGAVKCGHCFQTLNGICNYLESDPEKLKYIGAKKISSDNWEFSRASLAERFPGSYVDTRADTE
jgi:cytidine deaminase